MYYTIVKGNESKKFELIKKHGIWALHFKKRLKQVGVFDLIIHGRPENSTENPNELYEKPLTLRIHITVEE